MDLPIDIPFIGGKKKKKSGKGDGEYSSKYQSKLLEYLTSPSKIIQHVDDVQIEKHHRIISAVSWPRLVEAGWLTRLVEMNLDFDLAMHLVPYEIEKTIKMLENELKKQKTDLFGLEAEGKIVPQSLIQKHKDTKALLESIQGGTEKMFGISLYIDAKHYEKKKLDDVSRRIEDKMASLMITPKVPSFQMYKALRSTLPVLDDQLKITRDITSSATSACFPFVMSSLESKAGGVLLGFNTINDIPIIIDPFKVSNPNILVLGTSGGGKSYCIKLYLMREFLEGVDINVIDPQAEYTDFAKTFSGKTVEIAPGSDTVLNPFDLLEQTLDEKKLSLLSFFRVLMGEMDEGERAVLDDCIDATYDGIGITKDPKTWSKRPPIIGDLYDQVLPLTKSDKDIIYRPSMKIANRLKSYVTGPLRFINQQTKINMDNRVITFNIKDTPDVGKGTMMFLLLEFIYSEMKKSRKRKILVIDEAWTVLSAGAEGDYILRIVKTCRKFNLGLVMITQDVEDVLTSRAGRAVLSNTATKILMKQDPSIIHDLTDRFRLNEKEQRFLQTAGIGNALLILGPMRAPIRIKASPEEHRIITTNPDELIEMVHKAEAIDVKREGVPDLDITRLLQRKINLSNEQIDALVKIGFHEVRFKNLSGTSELFVIMNETGYTDERFVLQELIKEEISKYTSKVMIHYTDLADISFESNNRKMIGIEVVAEPTPDMDERMMNKKLPILQKYDEYFIVAAREETQRLEGYGKICLRDDVPKLVMSYLQS
ncbi:MAG: ATP-binding protein [Candidatus Altiarchaeota archaeon]|nr:ATP-binding protein [Candidatus Altiarchaeota archaeon]